MIRIKNYSVNTSILAIVTKLQMDTGNPRDIIDKGENVLITCPFHKDGNEDKPSCSINANEYIDIPVGVFQCWSCKEKGNIIKIISSILECSFQAAEDWLLDNFPSTIDAAIIIDDEIKLEKDKEEVVSLDSYEPLPDYAYDYLIGKRRLKKEVVDYFGLLYDRERDSVVFPVYDAKKGLISVTERSLSSKYFYIQKNSIKPVYLLYEAMRYKTVYVCESQINALTLWGWGYPAVALFGTGSSEQYSILNKSGIRNYVLCFDGDNAGKEGARKFIKNINSAMVYKVDIPSGKDVNDLTKEEFINLGMR